MEKSLLYVKFEEVSSKIYDELKKSSTYNIKLVSSYDEVLLVYKDGLFDFVIVNLDDKNKQDADFIVHFLLQQEIKQTILVIKNDITKCIFQQNCKMCQEEFNHKSINYSSTIDEIIKFIELPIQTKCDFTKLK